MKKIFAPFLVLVLLSALFVGCGKKEATQEAAETSEPAAKEIKNPDTFVYASYGTVESLDPSRAYDEVSGGVIQNLYETLVFFDGSAVDKFVPVLCEEVPTVENGGITNGGKTYTFKIKKGIKFHSGNELTPEVVRYSFIRSMVTDPDAGPVWMLYFPFFGTYSSRDGDGNIVAKWEDLQNAIHVEGDSVVFNLKAPFPPFLAILSGYWAAIVDKDFVIANGGWDGTEATWKSFNAPANGEETLNDIASGTGPYKLDRWERGVEVVMTRNEDFHGEKPVLAKAIYKVVDEWSTRKLMLLQGDADCVEVDPLYYDEMDKETGITVIKDLKELGVRAINFNQEINAVDNPAIYSGKLDGEGIPADFFTDKDVRLAFSYCWDEDTYLSDILSGAGIDCPTPHVSGLPYRNDSLKRIPYDTAKAEEYFKKAWGGQVWDKGFKMDFLYNTGNEVREASVKMLAENIMKLNPKFKINVRGVEWASYVQATRAKTLPLFYIGWGADYPHPDNFMTTYMHSQGVYGGRCGYNNPEADRLLEAGAIESDPAKAKEIYYRIQDIWLEDAPGIVMHQPVSRRYFKDWVKGYVFHPMENHPLIFSQFTKEY